MKKFSKILSVALLVALVLSLGVANAFADAAADTAIDPAAPAGRTDGTPLNNRSITLSNPSAEHVYQLFQIFTGTFQVIDGKDTLGDIAYGNGLKLTDGKYSDKTAEELAETIVNSEAGARAFANTVDEDLQNGVQKTAGAAVEGKVPALVWDNLSEGYYIIKDVTTFEAGSEDQADLVVVQVLDNVTITAKAGTTEFDKKVADRNDSTMKPTAYDEYGNTSDYDVGDDVPYEVTITLPANFSSYTTYQMRVHDKMDAGLSFNNDVKVYVGDSATPLTSGYVVNFPSDTDGETFDIYFAEVVGLAGAGDNVKFTVTYSAKLTGDNVVYGNPGNKNEAWLTYSNNPTTGGEGGTTPHKTTVTFTYKLEVDKTDGTNPLPGAEFALKKLVMAEDGTTSWTTLALIKNDAGTVFTFDGLDDGLYMIEETATPTGYNSIDPIYFSVVAEHSDKLTNLVVKQTNAEGTVLDTDKATAEFDVTLTKTSETANDAGLIKTEVVNNKGAVLPSTGGIGTTIFYVVGGVLVLAAIILLVTKKRMSE